MIITISGRPGSGKSVVASKLARELGIPHVSAGDFMREMASERGMSILELSRTAQGTDEIDREIDARTVRLASEGGSFVMDARLGWHFIPDSIKVFLDVSLEEAARRVFGADRDAELENVDFESTLTAIAERTESERLTVGLDDLQHSTPTADLHFLRLDGGRNQQGGQCEQR